MNQVSLIYDSIPALAASLVLYAAYRGYDLRVEVRIAASRRSLEFIASVLVATSLLLSVLSREAYLLRLGLAYVYVLAIGAIFAKTLCRELSLARSL
ncbi:MAG: hypothetical protein DRK00_11285, partial [Thermoprotei archaeon]